MIDKDALAEAARYNDAAVEEHGLETWLKQNAIDAAGLFYIIEQRALRAAMLVDGQDPTKMSRTEMTTVNLSPQVKKLLPYFQAAVLDGIAIGIKAEQIEAAA